MVLLTACLPRPFSNNCHQPPSASWTLPRFCYSHDGLGSGPLHCPAAVRRRSQHGSCRPRGPGAQGGTGEPWSLALDLGRLPLGVGRQSSRQLARVAWPKGIRHDGGRQAAAGRWARVAEAALIPSPVTSLAQAGGAASSTAVGPARPALISFASAVARAINSGNVRQACEPLLLPHSAYGLPWLAAPCPSLMLLDNVVCASGRGMTEA